MRCRHQDSRHIGAGHVRDLHLRSRDGLLLHQLEGVGRGRCPRRRGLCPDRHEERLEPSAWCYPKPSCKAWGWTQPPSGGRGPRNNTITSSPSTALCGGRLQLLRLMNLRSKRWVLWSYLRENFPDLFRGALWLHLVYWSSSVTQSDILTGAKWSQAKRLHVSNGLAVWKRNQTL